MYTTCHAMLSEVGEELCISLSRAGCGHLACCHSVKCTVVVLNIFWPKLAKEVLVTVVLIRYCSKWRLCPYGTALALSWAGAATSIIFVPTNMCLLRQTYFCCNKTFVTTNIILL